MAKNENIAKELKTRLSELTGRLSLIPANCANHCQLDFEEGATDLENQDALEGSRVLKFRKSIIFRGR